jgi:myo-inositol-hexaphosphate 3-phosphohydrolase
VDASTADDDAGDVIAESSRMLSADHAFVPAADDSAAADDPAIDDPAAADEDPCVTDLLTAGAWVHEAELSTADDGSRFFDAVSLVDDGS